MIPTKQVINTSIKEYIYKKRSKLWKPLYQSYNSIDSKVRSINWEEIEDNDVNFADITWFCGVEVHKEHIIWAFYGKHAGYRIHGPILRCYNSLHELNCFLKSIQVFHPERFLMETTGIFHFNVAWYISTYFEKSAIIVMNARVIHRIISSVRKNDRSDAQKLAILASYRELLRHSYVPTQEEANLRELTRMRINYKKEVTKIKNRIKKILAMHGFNWTFSYDHNGNINFLLGYLNSSFTMVRFLELCRNTNVFSNMKRYFSELDKYAALNLSHEVRRTLKFCFHSLQIHQEEVKMLEKQIFSLVESMPSFSKALSYIEAMPGMRTLSRISLLAEIGNINRFLTKKRFL